MSLRDDRGFTLIELLVGMALALVVFSASLTAFTDFYRSEHTNNLRFDTAEGARNALDTEARQLRNLAKRLNNTPVIDTVGSYDLIFQTSDPKLTWVRYCLDTTNAPASASRGRLWKAQLSLPVGTTSSPVSSGMRGACPGTGWTQTTVVADYVTNTINGADRPLFSYVCTDGTSSCTAAAAPAYDKILNISAQAIIDLTPGFGSRELNVSSGVYLRNQNQAPIASFDATPTNASRTVLLNGSGSTDYQGQTLSYYWFKGTMPTSIACNQPTVTLDPITAQQVQWGGTLIGNGITLSYTFPLTDGAAGTYQDIGLVVCNPGDRFGTAGVPAPGGAPAAALIPVEIPN